MQDYDMNGGDDWAVDASNANPENTFEALPAGTYHIQFDAFTRKQTRAGTGYFIECEYSVVGGEHEGRKIWDRFNIQNPNPQAVEIALGELRQFVTAVSKDPQQGMQPSKAILQQNLGGELLVKLKVEQGQNGPMNDVVEYFTAEGGKITVSGIVQAGQNQGAYAAPPAPSSAPPVPQAPVHTPQAQPAAPQPAAQNTSPPATPAPAPAPQAAPSAAPAQPPIWQQQ